VLIVLDSPEGGYPRDGGGETAAPVFSRIAQQVLAYMNVPHDVEVQDPKRMFLRAHAKEDEVFEGAPDHIASEQQTSEQQPGDASALQPSVSAAVSLPATPAMPTAQDARLRTVSATNKSALSTAPFTVSAPPHPTIEQKTVLKTEQARGTVVLDPDFHGKSLRSALEEAESAGLELEINGSGVGQDQSPVAGARIPPGGHVSVRFGR
jgi:cell division protein FtsI (penicillin-binding protein 3)